ncbi:MAG: ABC transporter substrate-binding protein [Deltaproteobacteria bacterium]
MALVLLAAAPVHAEEAARVEIAPVEIPVPAAEALAVGSAELPAAALVANLVAAPTPNLAAIAVVEGFNATLIDLLRRSGELDHAGRVAQLAPVLAASFDLDFMAQKVLGRRWRGLSPEEQAIWARSFTGLMTANYAGRFVGWADQSFTTLDAKEASHGTLLVRTRLVVPDVETVALDYRLKDGPDGWQIIDCFLNGTVSELALRRSEYSGVLKRAGFKALIAAVDAKRVELATATTP